MESSPLQAILGGNLDLQPTTPIALSLDRHELSAVRIRDVRALAFTGLQVHWHGMLPGLYRNAVRAEDFDNLKTPTRPPDCSWTQKECE